MEVGNISKQTNDSSIYYKFDVSKHLLYVTLSVLIVLINASVIVLFAAKKNLQKPPNYLLVSLSVSDLLTGLVEIPVSLVCSTTPNCVSCVISYTLTVYSSVSTMLHIFVISYERCIKIVFPFKMQQIGDSSFELKVIVLVWFVSLVVPLVRLTWSPLTEKACYDFEDEDTENKNRIFLIFFLTVFVALPALLLIFADVSVFCVFRRQLDRIDETSVGGRDSRKRLKKEIRVVGIFAFMLVYFVVCWSFYYISIFWYTIMGVRELLLPPWLIIGGSIARCTTALINPILYVLLKHDFRRALGTEIKRAKNTFFRKKCEDDTRSKTSNEMATFCKTKSRSVCEKSTFLTLSPEPSRGTML